MFLFLYNSLTIWRPLNICLQPFSEMKCFKQTNELPVICQARYYLVYTSEYLLFLYCILTWFSPYFFQAKSNMTASRLHTNSGFPIHFYPRSIDVTSAPDGDNLENGYLTEVTMYSCLLYHILGSYCRSALSGVFHHVLNMFTCLNVNSFLGLKRFNLNPEAAIREIWMGNKISFTISQSMDQTNTH